MKEILCPKCDSPMEKEVACEMRCTKGCGSVIDCSDDQ